MSTYSDNMPPTVKDAIGWMVDYIEPGSTFLDLRCGTGAFGSLIKQAKQAAVYGVAAGAEAEQARKVLDGVYSFDLDGDWPDSIHERQYDYIFLDDVIEYLKDPGAVLVKSKELLKPDGLLFITAPNVAHISIRLGLLLGNFNDESNGILRDDQLKYFTKQSLAKLVQASGYTVASSDFTPDDYPDAAVLRSLQTAGLTPDKVFWRVVNATEARAARFKLVLAKQSASNAPKQAIRVETPEITRNAVMTDLHHKIDDQAATIQQQLEHIKQLQAQQDILRFKLKHPLRNLASKAKNRL